LPSIQERADQGDHWSNLRSCAYLEAFERPKIIWGELSDKAKFTYDEEGHYLNNTIFMMTGKSLKYLLAVLNSKAAQWYFEEISTTSGMGTNRWLKYKVEQLPVPEPTPEQEQQLEALVTEILSRKKAGQDTQPLENEVDGRVMALYGLSETDVQHLLDSAPELRAADRAHIVAVWREVQMVTN
jgi:adenine-specific DNA-methyltransferase